MSLYFPKRLIAERCMTGTSCLHLKVRCRHSSREAKIGIQTKCIASSWKFFISKQTRRRRRLQVCPRGVLLGRTPLFGERRFAQEQAVEFLFVRLEPEEAREV